MGRKYTYNAIQCDDISKLNTGPFHKTLNASLIEMVTRTAIMLQECLIWCGLVGAFLTKSILPHSRKI